jgi:AcrR family transcriptional regulator
MIDDHRHRILQAAARVYTQHGWRGATTKRIAEEAGVNEVTLFRQFGSKEALLEQMIRELAAAKADMRLPEAPHDPEHELVAWASAHHQDMCGKRPLIRQLMSDFEERPELVPCAVEGPHTAMYQLRRYTEQLRTAGFLAHHDELPAAEIEAAISMFMGAVFADGMNRDVMPVMFTQPVDDTLRAYVRIFLRGVQALPELVSPDAPTSATPTLTSTSE